MSGAIPPLSHYAFMAWCLVKHKDNFTFYFNVAKFKYLRATETNRDCIHEEIKGKLFSGIAATLLFRICFPLSSLQLKD
jgi:hypothetical protein